MSKPKKINNSILDFESSLKEIEKIISVLEKQGTNLDESLSAFETGMGLSRSTQKILSEAEQKVQLLLGETDQPETQGFSGSDIE